MAGFAIDIGDTGAVVSNPVAPVTTSDASIAARNLQNVSQGLFGVIDVAMSRGGGTSEASINRGAYGSLVQGLLELGGIEDQATLNTKVGALIAGYEAQGFAIGDEEAAAVMRYTGINVKPVENPMDAASRQVIETLGQNPEWMFLAEEQLKAAGVEYTQADVVAAAASLFQNDQADALYLSTSKNITAREFASTYQPRANGLINNLMNVALKGIEIEAAGGNVSVESLTQLRAALASLNATLTRPANVSEDQFKPIADQLAALNQLTDKLVSFDTDTLDIEATRQFTNVAQVLLERARTEGDTGAALLAGALTTKEGRNTLSAQFYSDMRTALTTAKPEIVAIVGSPDTSTNLDFSSFNEALGITASSDTKAVEDFNTSNPEFGGGGSNPPPLGDVLDITTDGLYDRDFLERIQDLDVFSPADRVNLIDVANGIMVAIPNSRGVQDPDVRNNFTTGIGQIAATVSTSDRLFDPQYLSMVYSQNMFSTLDSIKALDPEAHSLATARIQHSLLSQLNILNTTYSGKLADSKLTISADGTIGFNNSNPVIKENEIFALQGYADRLYNGSIADLLEDSGRKIDNPNARSWTQAFVNDYNALKPYVAGMTALTDLLKRSGADPKVLEVHLGSTPAQREAANQEIINNCGIATTTLPRAGTPSAPFQFTGKTDAEIEAQFEALPAGAYFVNPADGRVLIKE